MENKVIACWNSAFAGFYKNVDAQKCADEIMSIGETASPQEIVSKAKDENTELHKCFTWNDKAAADKWRLQEARLLVCHLVIKREENTENNMPLRFFYKNDNDGYKPSALIFKNENEYEKLLMQALSELHSFKKKYAMLQELQEILDLIE